MNRRLAGAGSLAERRRCAPTATWSGRTGWSTRRPNQETGSAESEELGQRKQHAGAGAEAA